MLRILLIILVALAVIIGLMRLTGARSGDAAPAATTSEAVPEEAAAASSSEDMMVDEPAVDALDTPAMIEGETGEEIMEPGANETPAEAAAGEVLPADPEPIVSEPDQPGR